MSPTGRTSVRHLAVLVGVYVALGTFFAVKTQGLPAWGPTRHDLLCEHYGAFLHGHNLARHDLRRSLGLVDLGTSPNEEDHPIVYIHGSLLWPRLFVALLLRLGVDSIYHQTLIFVVASAAWVALAYLALARLFHPSAAFLSVLLMATHYRTIIHSVNLLRGWHPWVFAGTLWASARFGARGVRDYAVLGLALVAAVHFEFPFAGFCIALSTFVVYYNCRSAKKTLLAVGLPTAIGLAVYAAQVAWYLGGIAEFFDYARVSAGVKYGTTQLTDDLMRPRWERRIVLFGGVGDPVDMAKNALPTAFAFFIDQSAVAVPDGIPGLKLSGFLVSGLLVGANLFVFYWYLLRQREPGAKTAFPAELFESRMNIAYFILACLGALTAACFVFPAIMHIYLRRGYPLTVFWAVLAVPFLLRYLQLVFHRVPPAAMTAALLLLWARSQFKVYSQHPLGKDALIADLVARYRGVSFAVAGLPLEPVWYALQAAVDSVDFKEFPDRSLKMADLTRMREKGVFPERLIVARKEVQGLPVPACAIQEREYDDAVVFRLQGCRATRPRL